MKVFSLKILQLGNNLSLNVLREKNDSDRRRWVYLIAYNRRVNEHVYEHFLPGYTPLKQGKIFSSMKCSACRFDEQV